MNGPGSFLCFVCLSVSLYFASLGKLSAFFGAHYYVGSPTCLGTLLAFWVFHFGERAFNAKSKKNQENIKESLKKVDLRNYMT